MNRADFVSLLRKELKKLPPDEIESAVEYFEEYFEEATAKDGGMTEGEIVSELGSPRRVASEIKADYAARILEDDEKHKAPGTRVSAVWWIILGICAAPVSVPVALCLGTAVFCIVIAAVSVILSIYVCVIGCAVGAVILMVMGFLSFGGSISAGVLFFGAGLAASGITAAACAGVYIGTRALLRCIAKLGRNISYKREKRKMKKMTAYSQGGAGDE